MLCNYGYVIKGYVEDRRPLITNILKSYLKVVLQQLELYMCERIENGIPRIQGQALYSDVVVGDDFGTQIY